MPVNSTFASLSKNGFNGGGGGKIYQAWMSTWDVNLVNVAVSNLKADTTSLSITNDSLIGYGFATGIDGTPTVLNQNFITYISTKTGAIQYYGEFPSNRVLGAVTDSTGNKHILVTGTPNNILVKTDSNGNVLSSYSLAVAGLRLVIDSSDNLFVLGYSGTNIYLSKINSSTYSIIWSYSVNIGVTVEPQQENDLDIKIDSSNNLYVYVYASTSPYIASTRILFKFNNSGVIQWSRRLTSTTNGRKSRFAVDSSGNSYILLTNNLISATQYFVKIDTTGTKSFEYTCDRFWASIANNSAGTISLMKGDFNYPLIICNVSYTGTVQNNTQYNNCYVGSGVGGYPSPPTPTLSIIQPLLGASSTNLYLAAFMDNYTPTSKREIAVICKFNSDGTNTGINAPYNFSITNYSTTFNYTGTITSNSTTLPTFTSSTAISLTTLTFTTTATGATSSSTTIVLNNYSPITNFIGLA